MKRKKIVLSVVVIIFLLSFTVLNMSPTTALRTHLFFNGNPIIAFETELTKVGTEDNAQIYELSKPAFEKATESELEKFKVERVGLFYVCTYYGGV